MLGPGSEIVAQKRVRLEGTLSFVTCECEYVCVYICVHVYRARAHHIAIHPAISSFRAASGADTGIFEEKPCLVCDWRSIGICSFERSRAQLRQPRNAVQTDRGALLARVS